MLFSKNYFYRVGAVPVEMLSKKRLQLGEKKFVMMSESVFFTLELDFTTTKTLKSAIFEAHTRENNSFFSHFFLPVERECRYGKT